MALYEDKRLIKIHDEAVRKAMREMEQYAMTRVRKNGRSDDRATGNIIGAAFRHDTSRALDPHLHTHCIVMNATYDPVENKWKALQNYEMLKAQKFVENYYYHELVKGLHQYGYPIENNARDFELRGVSPELIEKFSKRHQQIDEGVRERLSRGECPRNMKELRAQIAHDNRARKIRECSADELRSHWREQMSPQERQSIAIPNLARFDLHNTVDMAELVSWADEHVFERKSVVEDHQLKAAALARGRGKDFNLQDLDAEIVRRDYLKNGRDHRITTRMALDREIAIVDTAKKGRNQHTPFCENYQPSIPTLSGEQKSAVERILGSRDYVTLFRGGAGTGKTFALQEVSRGLASAGYSVVVLAPQRQQVIDLQSDGFQAQTVARFLAKSDLPGNAVVIIDEAGQIGGKQMSELFKTLKVNETRIILSGDTRQHGAVEASDALRAIEKYARLPAAELTAIRRQDPAKGRDENERGFIGEYREAVKAASEGNVFKSFERLDALDCVEQVDEASRKAMLADDYLQARQAGEKTLVVAQTWDEIHAVNEAVRQRLKDEGLLGKESKLAFYESRDLDSAQKRDVRFYQQGDCVYFIKKYGRFKKGALAKVESASERGLSLCINSKVTTVSFKQSKHYVVVRPRELELAPGDRLQMKFNGKSVDDKAIVNGELVTVANIYKNGKIAVVDDRGQRKTLAPEQRLANLGYAVTSYASQGKTVDTVLFSDSQNRAATNRNQWYVSISRARRKIKIYTSDKEALRENLLRLGERTLALDFANANQKAGPWIRKGIDHAQRVSNMILKQAQQQLLNQLRKVTPTQRQPIKPPRLAFRHRQSRGIRQSM